MAEQQGRKSLRMRLAGMGETAARWSERATLMARMVQTMSNYDNDELRAQVAEEKQEFKDRMDIKEQLFGDLAPYGYTNDELYDEWRRVKLEFPHFTLAEYIEKSRGVTDVLDIFEERGVAVDEVVEMVQIVQASHGEGASPDQLQSEVRKALLDPVMQNAMVLGLTLDRLAEEGLISEPLLSILRSDEPLFGIDETLAMSLAKNVKQLIEFCHRDKHKVGKAMALDSKTEEDGKVRVGTMADDLIIMLGVRVDDRTIQGKHLGNEDGKEPVQNRAELHKRTFEEYEKLKKAIDYRPMSEEVATAGRQVLAERGITREIIKEGTIRLQDKYNVLLEEKDIDAYLDVILGETEADREQNPNVQKTHHTLLVSAEVEKLRKNGTISETEATRMEKALKGVMMYNALQNESIAGTSFGYGDAHPFADSEHLANSSNISIDLEQMLVAQAAGYAALKQRYKEENWGKHQRAKGLREVHHLATSALQKGIGSDPTKQHWVSWLGKRETALQGWKTACREFP